MKKFFLTLGLIAAFFTTTEAFAAPPPPPAAGGHITAGAHQKGHRPPPPPNYHHRKHHGGFTIYTGWNRPVCYNYYDDWFDGFYYRPRRCYPSINTGIYLKF